MTRLFEKIKKRKNNIVRKKYKLFGKTVFEKLTYLFEEEKAYFLFGKLLTGGLSHSLFSKVYNTLFKPKPSGSPSPFFTQNTASFSFFPQFSVILYGENESDFSDTLNSIIKQSYKHYELIVVDEHVQDKVKRILNENNLNISVQYPDVKGRSYFEKMKAGIMCAKGDYIAFCEMGSWFSDDHLLEKQKIISLHKEAVVIINDVKLIDHSWYSKYVGFTVNKRKQFFIKGINHISDALWKERNLMLSLSSCMVKADVLKQCNIESRTYPITLEWWLGRQFSLKNDIFYSQKVLTFLKARRYHIKECICHPIIKHIFISVGNDLLCQNEKTDVQFPKGCQSVEMTFGSSVFTKRRAAVFASYSKNGLISDYVVYYLRELRKVVDVIAFVMDAPLFLDEIEKIKPYVNYVLCQRHREYDFGSYKRGLTYLYHHDLLSHVDDLILCNDSCFGPILPFDRVLEDRSRKKVDFYGISRSNQINHHIQSFFYIFTKKVFNSDSFIHFFENVVEQSSVHHVILKYEIKLTKFLENKGFHWDTWFDFSLTGNSAVNLINDKRILLKIKMFNGEYDVKESDRKRIMHQIKDVNAELYDIIRKHITQ